MYILIFVILFVITFLLAVNFSGLKTLNKMKDVKIERLELELKLEEKGRAKVVDQLQKTTIQMKEWREEYHQYNIFLKALGNRDPNKYEKNFYNCYDQSQELQKELQEVGIKSSIMVNEGRTHAWLAVWVEATSGKFKILSGDQHLLEVRDENLNVICSK